MHLRWKTSPVIRSWRSVVLPYAAAGWRGRISGGTVSRAQPSVPTVSTGRHGEGEDVHGGPLPHPGDAARAGRRADPRLHGESLGIPGPGDDLSLIHISEPTRLGMI